jgi:hypothetical protein
MSRGVAPEDLLRRFIVWKKPAETPGLRCKDTVNIHSYNPGSVYAGSFF